MGLINRQVEFQPGETAKAEEVNSELNTIHQLVNGNIENINISDSSIDLSQKGEDSSILASVISDDAVTISKINDQAQYSIEQSARTRTDDLKIETRTSDVSASTSNAGRIWLRTDL